MNQKPNPLGRWLIVSMCLVMMGWCWACGATDGTRKNQANVAVKKCKDDGYQVIPVTKNGVPSGHVCVNPETGKKCEVWKYFRGECRLDAKPSQEIDPQKTEAPVPDSG